MRLSAAGFVCAFFLNGMVFLSGRGGGQWDFSEYNTPAIGLGPAGGSTAGLAQLWIVVFGLGGVRGCGKERYPMWGTGATVDLR